MKRLLSIAAIGGFLMMTGPTATRAAQEPDDFEILARLRTEEALREQQLKELREAAGEISSLSEFLVAEAALADGYTTSASLVEATNRVEDLAEKIKDLAKKVRDRAQGR